MADKGFVIHKELNDLGLQLNVPPFAHGDQMKAGDVSWTQTIANHRIHIERVIGQIKKYKIVSNTIQTSLFHQINQIWTVCCYMTLLQDTFVLSEKS